MLHNSVPQASSGVCRAGSLQRLETRQAVNPMLQGRIAYCAVLWLLAPWAQALTIYKYTDANGVVTYTDQATRGAQVFVFRDQMVEKLDQQVTLSTTRHAGGEQVLVKNDLYAPVEVQISLENASNVQGAPARGERWVVPARSQVSVLNLSARDPGAPMRYTPRMRYALGDPNLTPVPYAYPLPWRGGPFRLTQGANGKYSHFTPKGRYALDIAMPEGTPIVAARSGVVVKTENQQTGRGTNPSGNFVRVLHDDGTMGVYLHLMKGSVTVQEGSYVSAGQQIARSGNTGNSTGPHLHFVVQRNVGLALESIPFEFDRPVNSLPNFAVGGE